MAPDKTLEKHGVGSGSAITIVRRVLVPEGKLQLPCKDN